MNVPVFAHAPSLPFNIMWLASLARTQLRADHERHIPSAIRWRWGESHLMQCAHVARPEPYGGMQTYETTPSAPHYDTLILETMSMNAFINETMQVSIMRVSIRSDSIMRVRFYYEHHVGLHNEVSVRSDSIMLLYILLRVSDCMVIVSIMKGAIMMIAICVQNMLTTVSKIC